MLMGATSTHTVPTSNHQQETSLSSVYSCKVSVDLKHAWRWAA